MPCHCSHQSLFVVSGHVPWYPPSGAAPRVLAKFPEPCKWQTRCPQSSDIPNMIHTVPSPSPVTLLPIRSRRWMMELRQGQQQESSSEDSGLHRKRTKANCSRRDRSGIGYKRWRQVTFSLPMTLAGTSHEDFHRNINGNGLPVCSIRCEAVLSLPPEFSERNSNKHFFGARPQ